MVAEILFSDGSRLDGALHRRREELEEDDITERPTHGLEAFLQVLEGHARLGGQIVRERIELLGPVGMVVVGRRGRDPRKIDGRSAARLDGHRVGGPDVEPVGPIHGFNLLRHRRSPSSVKKSKVRLMRGN